MMGLQFQSHNEMTVRVRSDRGTCDLAVVVCSLHFKDIWDDTVDRYITDKASKKQLLSYIGIHQTQRW